MTTRIDPPAPAANALLASELVARLRNGGVIAYPTEAVWGLGCDPFSEAAVSRLLAIKQRPLDKGLILIAGALAQFDGLIDWQALPPQTLPAVTATWPGPPHLDRPCHGERAALDHRAHDGVAVRVSAHPVVIALCNAFAGRWYRQRQPQRRTAAAHPRRVRSDATRGPRRRRGR